MLVSLATFVLVGFVAGCDQGGGGHKVTADSEARKAMIDAKKNYMQEKVKSNRPGGARGGPSGP